MPKLISKSQHFITVATHVLLTNRYSHAEIRNYFIFLTFEERKREKSGGHHNRTFDERYQNLDSNPIMQGNVLQQQIFWKLHLSFHITSYMSLC